MFKVEKVIDYKAFAELLEERTGCSIEIEVKDRKGKHIHFQLNDKYNMSLGVLCICDGEASFAPFATHKSVSNEQYINIHHMVQRDDFVKILGVFEKLFVSKEKEYGV